MKTKKLAFNSILILVFFSILTFQVLARSSFSLGTQEVKVSKELAEGEVETYKIELESNIAGISYYIRSNQPSMCWVRVYDPSGEKIHSKNFGNLFGRFLGRSETETIENMSNGQYTLDVMSPSYGTCGYELYLTGLTEDKLLSNHQTVVYKTNQELIKKEDTINSLKKTINNLKEELDEYDEKITKMEKENEDINKTLNLAENTIKKLNEEKEDMQKRINLLTKLFYALVIVVIGLVSYYFYRRNQKRNKK